MGIKQQYQQCIRVCQNSILSAWQLMAGFSSRVTVPILAAGCTSILRRSSLSWLAINHARNTSDSYVGKMDTGMCLSSQVSLASKRALSVCSDNSSELNTQWRARTRLKNSASQQWPLPCAGTYVTSRQTGCTGLPLAGFRVLLDVFRFTALLDTSFSGDMGCVAGSDFLPLGVDFFSVSTVVAVAPVEEAVDDAVAVCGACVAVFSNAKS